MLAIGSETSSPISQQSHHHSLNSQKREDIFKKWGEPAIDLFASHKNKQAPFYYRKPAPGLPMAEGCIGEDAFSISWDMNNTVYCNPPWTDISLVIEKIIRDKPKKIIVIAPKNKRLDELSNETINLRHTTDLFIPQSRQKLNTPRGVGLPTWNKTFAYLITNNTEIPKTRNQDSKSPETTTESVPRISKRDSRFLFTGNLEGKLGKILVDSGCTVNIISAAFCKKHRIPTTSTSEPIELTLANNASTTTSTSAQITLTRNNYARIIDCFVSEIKYDMMLGTSWLESIKIMDLEWRFRSLEFRCNKTMLHHRWNSIHHKEKSNLRRVTYNSPQEFTRNTQWCAVIDIREIDALERIEVMNTENETQKESKKEIDSTRLSRIERVRANNRRIIREHTASRKITHNPINSTSASSVDTSPTSATTSDGMYNYQPEKEIPPSRSMIPDDEFEKFINKHGNQLVETDSLP